VKATHPGPLRKRAFLLKENIMTSTERTLIEHKTSPASDALTITAVGVSGAGGASHLYLIEGFDAISNLAHPVPGRCHLAHLHILFQNGPIPQAGVNGITNEALLAIVADRLRSFQSDPYACVDNAKALHHIEQALHYLKQRTRERMARGVEGSYAV